MHLQPWLLPLLPQPKELQLHPHPWSANFLW
jgi:hypothetical protein